MNSHESLPEPLGVDLRLLGGLRREFEDAVQSADWLSYIARDSALQREALLRIQELTEQLATAKARVVAERDAETANAYLALECVVKALRAELAMCLAIKEERPEEAWDLLIEAEESAAAAIRAHDIGKIVSRRIAKYELLEFSVYPRQSFMSVGVTAFDEDCSICGRAYSNCDHVAGRAYMGEFCRRIVRNSEGRETSLASIPADKRCRVTEIIEPRGRRNCMTGALTPTEGSGNGQP